MSLSGKTLFITGASRGIGLAIALRAARDGANIVVAAKTADPHPKLPGTIYTAADEIAAAGGAALPLVVDVRDEASVQSAVDQAVERFGGIDILVNNASAISLTGTLSTDMKRYDLMHQVNTRGTFLTSKACIPHLKKSANPHVLMLSPPLDMSPRWFGGHVAYTMAKFGMSMCVLGMAEEFKSDGIAFNALWPRTGIATAAIQFALTGEEGLRHCRTPEIMADAAHAIFEKPSRELTGQFLIDDTFLYGEGVRDFDQYRVDPTATLMPDFFVPEDIVPPPGVVIG
ncbi:short chain dehydrogenase [Caulobacter sp. D4A]|uniref:SDR family oxidoreductase n=1 Tax=unclassified Caulobacter TaxID=2648921 RepID=UPI000D731443|nr:MULTISPECIES: NAD(P)-dependent oxidoreductase [unclassified Caulobacter]PXA86330.1 short chain dehydrogenase [Caulobacter sp. D4A]PXA90470.1 short chain dehydrogenase [Caulobacter sp. D5]